VPGSLGHLVRRFFDVLLAKPLSTDEVASVNGWLRDVEAEVFFDQATPDQRHGHHAAGVVVAAGETNVTIIRAALLHDVGKRHAGLGVVGRSLASVSMRLGLPTGRRGRLYRDHGALAAKELAALGCEPVIVDFARNHHGSRPATIASGTWDLLQLADEAPKTMSRARARIT